MRINNNNNNKWIEITDKAKRITNITLHRSHLIFCVFGANTKDKAFVLIVLKFVSSAEDNVRIS